LTALQAVDTGIWTAQAPLRFIGLQVGRRMTVVRLTSGDLWVHSPAPLDDALREALAALGPVRFVVAASLLHGHLSMGDYAHAYPTAALLAPPGLRERRADLAFAGDLSGEADPRWATELDQAPLRGHRYLTEVLFLHRASRSLIVGDACWNSREGLGLPARIWAGGRRIGPTPAFRLAVRDRAAARASVERVLAWDFDRIVTGHGATVERGGREAFEHAYAWLER
jgi:Domain of unknown function (DUF4336)